MEKMMYKVNKVDELKRLDIFVLEKCPIKVSRSIIQESIRNGAVTVNGGMKKTHYLVKDGDEVIIYLDDLKRLINHNKKHDQFYCELLRSKNKNKPRV